MGRLVVLAGPSCVGKGPLLAALRKFYPEVAQGLTRLVLYNSRPPRPGEADGVDYHFRRREEIERLRQDPGFVVMDVRGDLQALDLRELERLLAAGDALFEGNPFMGQEVGQIPVPSGAQLLKVFLSPLSREEVLYLRAPERHAGLPHLVTELMRRKLLRRMTRQKGVLSQMDLEEAERRASSAYGELKLAWRFDHVIPNHDGEDSENWSALYYPVGDARKAFLMFAELLAGGVPAGAEKWEEDLLA